MSWSEFVDAVRTVDIEYPHLKEVMLAQAMLETGRGTSDVFSLCKNAHGMKWRPEMADYAVPQFVEVNSEPEGHATFCRFPSFEKAVLGYWRFLERSPYDGWKKVAGHGASDFLAFIGPTWCPPGYTEAYKKEHDGLTYHEYILEKLLPEARTLIRGETLERSVTWFELTRSDTGSTVVLANAGAKTKAMLNSNNKNDIIRFLQKFPNALEVRVAPAGKEVPHLDGYTRGGGKVTRPHRFLLDPGHSNRHPGAQSARNSDIKEEKLNQIQATVIQQALVSAGHICDIYDPEADDLRAIGRRAKGYDCFVSLHHNSHDGFGDPGTEVFVDNDKYSKGSVELAQRVVDALAEAVRLKNRGVKYKALAVLDEAEQHTSGPCILTENNFITNAKYLKEQELLSVKGAEAIADALLKWAEDNPV